jgi:hypothetical protein
MLRDEVWATIDKPVRYTPVEPDLFSPVMSDGTEGPPLALRGLFKQFHGETP